MHRRTSASSGDELDLAEASSGTGEKRGAAGVPRQIDPDSGFLGYRWSRKKLPAANRTPTATNFGGGSASRAAQFFPIGDAWGKEGSCRGLRR
jgi:hypothetical protein